MSLSHNHTHTVGYVAHSHSRLTRHTQHIDAFATIVYLLHKREGHEHRLLIVTVDVHIAVGIVYANNTEVYRVDAYHVATRIATLRK